MEAALTAPTVRLVFDSAFPTVHTSFSSLKDHRLTYFRTTWHHFRAISGLQRADLRLSGHLPPFQGALHPRKRKYKRLCFNAIKPFWGRVYFGNSPLKRR